MLLSHKLKQWLATKYQPHQITTSSTNNFMLSLRDYGQKEKKKQIAMERTKNYLKKSQMSIIPREIKDDRDQKIDKSKQIQKRRREEDEKENDGLIGNFGYSFQKGNKIGDQEGEGGGSTDKNSGYQMMFVHSHLCNPFQLEIDHDDNNDNNIDEQLHQLLEPTLILNKQPSHIQFQLPKQSIDPNPSPQPSPQPQPSSNHHYRHKLQTKLSSRILSKQLKHKKLSDLASDILHNRKLKFIETFNMQEYTPEQQQDIVQHLLEEIMEEQKRGI